MKQDETDNFEEYSLEDEEESGSMTLFRLWKAVFTAIAMPASGWKLIKERMVTPEAVAMKFLLPVSILAAGSVFFGLIYDVSVHFTDLLVDMVVTFFTFFLGYYISILIARIFMPAADRGFPMTDYGRKMASVSVGTLALINILYNAVPLFDFIIEFFPLWLVYMLYKAMNLADIDRNKSTYSLGVMCVSVICSPILIEWFFSLFTPAI